MASRFQREGSQVPRGEGPVRVAVCDDAHDIRLLVGALVEMQPGMELAGEAADGETALRVVATADPDVLVLDMELPGAHGLDVVRRLRAEGPRPAIIVFSGTARDEVLGAAREAGADAYVRKGEGIEQLQAALERAAGLVPTA